MPLVSSGVFVWCDPMEGSCLLPASFQRSEVYCLPWMSCSGLALGLPQGLGSSLLSLACPCHQSHKAWPNATHPCVDVAKGGGTGTTRRSKWSLCCTVGGCAAFEDDSRDVPWRLCKMFVGSVGSNRLVTMGKGGPCMSAGGGGRSRC